MSIKVVRKSSKCKGCPLDGAVTQKVHGQCDREDAQIILLGEAPGAEEDQRGVPFVGQAGWIFKRSVEATGNLWHNAHKTNVICCRPPKNKIASAEGAEAVSRCRAGLFEELYALYERGAKVIVAAGATAMGALGITGSVHKLRGSVFMMKWVQDELSLSGVKEAKVLVQTDENRYDMLVLVTFHPAFLGYDKDPRHEVTFINDLEKAYELNSDYKPPEEHFEIFPTAQQVVAFVEEQLKKKNKPLLAIDIETSGFVPRHASIIVVGIATDGNRAISLPFLKQGGAPYWSPEERKQVHSALARLLKECPTMYQNALFDCRHLLAFCTPAEKIAQDVMVLHHCISAELPHNLGYIVSIYGKTPYWKDEVLGSLKNALSIDDENMRTYNLRDTVVLHQVLGAMIEDAKDNGTYEIYQKIAMPLIEPVMQMIENGMLIDRDRLKKWKISLKRRSTALIKKLYSLGRLHKDFNIDSGDDLRYLFYGIEPNKLHSARRELREQESNPRKKKGTKKHKEALLTVEVFDETVPFIALKHTPLKTESGSFSVNDEALLNIQTAAINMVQHLSELRRLTPEKEEKRKEAERVRHFIAVYREYAEVHKLLTTYTSFPLDSDNRLRSPYRTTGTKTGRLASGNKKAGEGGNVQNIPKEAKKIFVAPEAHVLLQLDYSNLELRILAEVSDDKVAKKAFAEGKNIHDENTKAMFGLSPEDPMWDAARRACKTYIFGRNYGGGLKGIHGRVTKAVPELNLTYSHFCERDKAYRSAHPSYEKWYNETVKQVQSERCLTNAFGRKRYFLGRPNEIIREGLNFPIQCLRYGTRVLTSDLKWVSVETIQEGDSLVGFDEELTNNDGKGHRKWKYATVTHAEKDVQYVYKITFDDEKVVYATGEHKWLCYPYNEKRNGYTWIRTDELRVERTHIPVIFDVWTTDTTNDGGYIAGAFDADGTLYQTGTHTAVHFCQVQNCVIDKVKRIIKNRGFNFHVNSCTSEGKREFNYEWISLYIKGGIPEQLRFLGMFRPVRLLERFNLLDMSRRMANKGRRSRKVIGLERVQRKAPIVRIATDTKTFFAEGMPTHNSNAADTINTAMIALHKLYKEGKIKAKMIGQVHDSLLFEVPKSCYKRDAKVIKAVMEAPVTINGRKVSFPVDVEVGPSWGEMKEITL